MTKFYEARATLVNTLAGLFCVCVVVGLGYLISLSAEDPRFNSTIKTMCTGSEHIVEVRLQGFTKSYCRDVKKEEGTWERQECYQTIEEIRCKRGAK
jgi:hypothetical protein